MQSNNGGIHRNFELLVATTPNETIGAGFTHLSRDGTSERWSTVSASEFGQNDTLNAVGQPVIIGTSYNKGDFHSLVRTSKSTIEHWVLGDTSYSKSRWRLEAEIKTSDNEDVGKIDGHTGFVQPDDSSLVMVVRHSDGSLREVRSSHAEIYTDIPYHGVTLLIVLRAWIVATTSPNSVKPVAHLESHLNNICSCPTKPTLHINPPKRCPNPIQHRPLPLRSQRNLPTKQQSLHRSPPFRRESAALLATRLRNLHRVELDLGMEVRRDIRAGSRSN